ncbi:MAG TPA: alpha/beta hydrolase-fold protein [Lysobacter sp.]|nr:alpha/beta hydrolase-fold protein [Lysobacter sp.]
MNLSPFRLLLAPLLSLAAALAHAAPPGPEVLRVDAPGVADAPLRVRVYLPPQYARERTQRYPVLYVNDGQDMEAVGLADALRSLNAERAIRPLIVVAIDMPPDRLGAYGLSDRGSGRSLSVHTEHGPLGARTHAYSEWLAHTLIPLIDKRYRTRAVQDGRAMLGWSLGGAHAFNMGWQYPELFGRIGAFSPSFWIAEDRSSPESAQRTRLALRMVDATAPRSMPAPRFFFGIGTHEETDDRDGDGVNDALDDVRDLIEGWTAPDGTALKGLRQLGFSINREHATRPNRADVALHVLDGGVHHQSAWKRMLPAFLRWAYAVRAPALTATGTVESWQDVPSRFVAARHVDVWLPPGYGRDPQRRYPVLYMHDGQNVFDPALSYTGIDWDVDGAMTRLIAEGRVREAIVVGVWNTPRRLQEYMPRRPMGGRPLALVPGQPPLLPDDVLSDGYLRFLVEELKPFIDRTYRTRTGPADTAIMGSSMGGLISLYAASEYPHVFGAVGAVSTHWPAGDGLMIDYLREHLPAPRAHRFYFDLGTATLDAQYPPYQRRMDEVMHARGYRDGVDWMTRVYEGAEHNERAWRDRLDVPLTFLLPPEAGR